MKNIISNTLLFLFVFCSNNLLFSQNQSEKMYKGKLIYVYDALCGWCYGFSNVITQVEEKYKDDFDFEVISGGMVRGERIAPITGIAPYIKGAYKDVEKRSGVKFGEKFLNETLNDEKVIMSSIKPAIALSIIKEKFPEKSIKTAAALQKAIYMDGMAPDVLENYTRFATFAEENESDFLNKMKEEKYLAMAEQDFYTSKQLGLTGFPTLLLEINGKYYAISRGFSDFNSLDKQLSSILKK
jgi:putative protein-disulfide isomerase